MNLLQPFILFLKSQKKQPSKITVKNYKADVGQFIRWFQESFHKTFNPPEITPHIIEIYKKEKTSLSPKTVKRHMSSLRSFFRFLKLEGLVLKDPFNKSLPASPKKEDIWHIKEFKNYLYVYNASNLTIKNYTNDVLQFLKWAERVTGAIHAWNLKEQDVLRKIDSSLFNEYKYRLLHEAKLAPKSINRKLSSLRKYLAWIEKEGIIKPVDDLESNVKYKPTVIASEQSERSNLEIASGFSNPRNDNLFSRFPPIRLFQKLLKASNYILEYLFIIPLAALVNQTESLFLRKKIKFAKANQAKKQSSFLKLFQKQSSSYIPNIPKSFYAPISTSYLPFHKKLIVFLKHKRPKWYKQYHASPISSYIHFSILIIIVTSGTLFFFDKTDFLHSPPKAILSTHISPKTLFFTGKLLDRLNNPINSPKDVTFSLYNHPTNFSNSLIWKEVHTISPNSDGTFSVVLGINNPLSESIFSENEKLFLGIQVGSDEELSPRQQIPTTQFSQNALTLDGLSPITQGDAKNVVLSLNSSGNLVIGQNASPTFQATGGTFTLSGKSVILNTVPGSNGNIELSPDGFGSVDIQKPIINSSMNGEFNPGAVEIDDKVIINATESAVASFIVNNNSSGDLITASSSGATKFVIDSDGWVGIGTAAPQNALDIKGNITPVDTGLYTIGSPLASWKNIYTQNVFPTLISGTQGWWQRNSQVISPLNSTDDLILGGTASDSSKLRIEGLSGNIISKGNFTFDNVSGLIQTTNNQTLTLGGTNTGNILVNPKNSQATGYFGPQTDNVTDLGASSSARFKSLYVGPSSLHVQCTTTDGCGQTLDYAVSISTTSGNLQIGVNGTTPNPNSYLVITQGGNIGFGTSTPSAFLDIAGSASVSGSLSFRTGAGSIQTTGNNSLTIGGNTTGNITLSPLNGSGTVLNTGTMNLSSGKTYQINATDVLSATTLGTAVVNSSLTQVGTISTGTWQATSIKANYGGTGLTTYSTGDILYAASSNPTSLSKRSIGSSNQVLTVLGGVPTWQTPPFLRSLGTVAPTNITDDLLVGGNSTAAAKFLVSGTTGNVGIGTTNPAYKLHVSDSQSATAVAMIENTDTGANSVALALKLGFTTGSNTNYFTTFLDGNGQIQGKIQSFGGGVKYSTTGVDFAEYFRKSNVIARTQSEAWRTKQSFEPGDLVCLAEDGGVGKCDQTNNNILGIVSDRAGFVGGSDHDNDPNYVLVGLLGQLPLKVSTESGDIKPGDYLTNSSVPGVAMKATRAGRVVGRALSEPSCSVIANEVKQSTSDGIASSSFDKLGTPHNDNNICIVNTILQPSFHDPDVYLTDTGNLSIDLDPTFGSVPQTITQQDQTISFSLNNKATDQLINRIGTFSKAVIANLEAGYIHAKELAVEGSIKTSELATQTLTAANGTIDTLNTNILNTKYLILDTKVVSPIAYVDQIHTDTISPLSSDSVVVNGRLVIASGAKQSQGIASSNTSDVSPRNDIIVEVQNASGSAVATIDSTGNASFSGQLTAQSGQFNNLTIEQFNNSGNASIGGVLRAGTIIADNLSVSDYLKNLNSSDSPSILSFPKFNYGFISLGPSTFTDASFTGTVSIGSPNTGLVLTDNSINVLDSSLEIQPLRQGGINFLGGLITFDIEGNMQVKGNATFEKTLTVTNASGPAVFAVSEQGNVVASGSGTFSKLNLSPISKALALSSSEIIATGSAGIATISAYQSELTIRNSLVTEKSLIYITPNGNTNNEVLYLLRQVPNESFTVGVNNQPKTDIPFNWLIVN